MPISASCRCSPTGNSRNGSRRYRRVVAALGLLVLFAVGTPSTAEPGRVVALAEPAEESRRSTRPNTTSPPSPTTSRRPRSVTGFRSRSSPRSSRWNRASTMPRSPSKGARGLMQLMPQTSAMMGVRDPHSPDENIDAGASHLRAMLDTFKGDLPLALAAYNAGEQNVVRYHGIPPYPETRRFVARVLREMGDKQGAERVMAKSSVPAPVWTSRTARTGPGGPDGGLAEPRPTLMPLPAVRTERASQVVFQEGELQPSIRSWAPASSPRRADPAGADRPARAGSVVPRPLASRPPLALRWPSPGHRAGAKGASMRFGIFYEHQLPRPWDEGGELQLFQDALDQVELADRLGIDYAWEVEHHFLEEYSHSSAPEVFLAAVLAAHQAHPPRPRHRADAAGLQPPGARRRAHRHARPRLQRPRRLRHRRVGLARRARGLRHRPGREARDVARGDRAGRQHAGDGPVPGLRRASTSRCRAATWCPSRCRSRTRRCGWRARTARPSTSPPSSASAR